MRPKLVILGVLLILAIIISGFIFRGIGTSQTLDVDKDNKPITDNVMKNTRKDELVSGNGKTENPESTKDVETVKKPQSTESIESVFPDHIMVLDASETTPVNIRLEPLENSESLGIVYGSLMHVEVLNNLDNGYSEVSTWDYKTMKPLRGYVATKLLKQITPKKDFKVLVSIDEQRVYVYKDDKLFKNFLCSTGVDEDKQYTPKGIYLLGDRGEFFYNPRIKEGGHHWVRFCNNYLFHSVPFDASKEIIPAEAEKLGQRASHGCIRLALDDAKWFYENMPRGTMVVIK